MVNGEDKFAFQVIRTRPDVKPGKGHCLTLGLELENVIQTSFVVLINPQGEFVRASTEEEVSQRIATGKHLFVGMLTKYAGLSLLKTIRSEDQPFSLLKNIDIVQQIANGLVGLSAERIVHGALSLSKIVMDDSGRVTITGFGNSSRFDAERSVHASYYNSAPETRTGQLDNSKADIWSLGLLTYELLWGQKLSYPEYGTYGSNEPGRVEEAIYQFVVRPFPLEETLSPTLTNKIRDLVSQCLELEPVYRLTAEKAFESISGIRHDILNPSP
jgi:serine/threonine protein kinase